MMFELVDDTMTYAGNVPEIFSMRDYLYIAPIVNSGLDMDIEDNLYLPDDALDLAVA